MDLLRAFQPWATMLFNTNFAVNFLLYCVSGRNFRKSLRRLVTSNNSKEIHSQLPRMSSQHGHHRSTGLPAERSPNVQRTSGFEREATTVHRNSSVAMSEHQGPPQIVFTRVEGAQESGSNDRSTFSDVNGNKTTTTL